MPWLTSIHVSKRVLSIENRRAMSYWSLIEQDSVPFADNIFKGIITEYFHILTQILLNFVLKGPIDN